MEFLNQPIGDLLLNVQAQLALATVAYIVIMPIFGRYLFKNYVEGVPRG